jgi:microcystin-dependent protein
MEPFIGDIRIVGFNFAPRNWATCDGQIIPIQQNQALYSILGNMYGGDGRTTFALPDMRGRAPVHNHDSPQGQRAGEEMHTLRVNEVPAHTHTLMASSDEADQKDPSGHVLADTAVNLYSPADNLTGMNPNAVPSAGGGQAHNNMQPYLALNFVIALQGVYPSRD